MEIREADLDDVEGIYLLYKDVMGYDYPIEKMKMMLQIVKKDQCNYAFIAVEQMQVVGVIEVVVKYSIHKDAYLIINTLAVLSQYQGKGIGGRLLNYVETFAKERGLSHLTLGSQCQRTKAHQFYIKHHFQFIKDHKIFEKHL